MWHVALIKFIIGKELPLTSNAFLAKIEINGGRFFLNDTVSEPLW